MQKQFHIILLFLAIRAVSFEFPVSMAVVRNIPPPLSVSNFLSKIGCCQFDSNGQPNGYTVISLDGFKSISTSASIQTGATPLSQWMNAFSAIASSKSGLGGNTTASVQSYLMEELHRNGVTLLMNSLSEDAPISEHKLTASNLANNIITMVRQGQFDGVSIQFSDYQAVSQGTASSWLQQMLLILHSGLQGKKIVLIVPVSFVHRIPFLQQSLVSSLVDLFVLKYYGFSQEDYTSYNSLFLTSSIITDTAYGQLLKSKTVGIDLCRTVIAKPANGRVNSYIGASILSSAFQRARKELGWFGGYANLDFQSDNTNNFQLQVLSFLRRECLNKGDCFCN